MRAKVAENSAILIRVPEPIGPSSASTRVATMLGDLVRSDIDGLDDFTDRALANKITRVDGGLHFEQLAVHDRIDTLGFGDGLAHFGQLLERGQPRLIREDVLAPLHGAHGDARAFAGDLRGENELD